MYIHNILHNVIYIFGMWYNIHIIGGGGDGGLFTSFWVARG